MDGLKGKEGMVVKIVWCSFTVDHGNRAALFAETPHRTLSMDSGSAGDT